METVNANPKKFKYAFRGYDIDEVDEYIEKKLTSNDEVMKEQRTRIVELTEENARLQEELSQHKDNRNNISDALLSANQKADQIISEARILADAEIERVRIFQSKWEFFAKKIMDDLAPKQRQMYRRMSDRIDETLSQFANRTEQQSIPMTSQSAVHKEVNTDAEINPTPAIELTEVYDTQEDLKSLLDDLL